jgi:4-amino-4-deoxy-L-arabinose transferase-like glycosyltransferase
LFYVGLSHSCLLSIACVLTLAAAIRYLETPSWRSSAWLGAAIGCGLLTKFSYPLFLGGLLLAMLSMPETRRALAKLRLLLAVVIALAIVLPYLLWLIAVQGNIAAATAVAMVHSEDSYLVRAAVGLGRLALSLPLFLLPWIVFIALLAPVAFRRRHGPAPAAEMPERLAGRAMAFAALLAALGIVAVGTTNIAERYMHAILIIAPVYVFARIARLAPEERPMTRRFAVFFVGAAVIVLGFRVVTHADTPLTRRADRQVLLPYEQLANALAERKLAQGTVFAPDIRDAGNLRAFLPDLRVSSPGSFRLLRPPRRPADEASCILIWRAGLEDMAREWASIDGLHKERLEVQSPPSLLGKPKHGVWFLVRLSPASPLCR